MTQTQAGSAPAASTPAAAIKTGMVVVRRSIPATADELFDAWLDPESLAQWMNPGDHRRNTVSVDARVGGAFEIVMHHQDGSKRHYGEYRVIERNKKLVFTWHSQATHHTETLVTVEFHAASDSTEIVLTHERMPDHEAGLKHTKGWTRALELLEDFLKH
ncbi:MAG: hypothetical protein JWQ90_5560 [Hydrocarboniphaga sp.]|uniref:SRPBCC family protein n=1 Tax=Hydrocarboniphaga sp. TaxID=2033016 RepID=UPI00260F2C25|nr:SRPBCC domain-containing protein [Hydrocarboniphaga sp.]MDB5973110.1 hypothetical protein [Hydrocarboniphaga sp.]